jgi:CubicO group peptidase (beta-lactamase class C family)
MFEFDRVAPQEKGVDPDSIRRVLEALDKRNIPMHSLLILKDDRLIFEKYYAPYKKDTLHRMFSISKSFTATAVALLTMEEKVSLDDKIADYFPEYVDDSTHPYIKMMTIRNMLQMRTCHASTTYKVNMKEDWVKSFFTVAPTHKPGTIFHYDTSAAHVLCALAEKLSGTDMLSYMKERMLKHVDFSSDSYMVKDPFGVSIGGSGLMATPMDVLKFLYILSKNGRIVCSDGVERSLLPEGFVKEATSNISDTLVTGPVPSEMQGYGMQIWQNEKGGFVLYGMGGQLGISIPERNMLVMTTADTQGIAGGNQVIYDAIYENLLGSSDESPYTEGITGDAASLAGSSYKDLLSYADTLRIAPPRLPENYGYTGAYKDCYTIPALINEIVQSSSASGGNVQSNGKSFTLRYKLDDNKSGFGELTITLDAHGTSTLSFKQEGRAHTINFGVGSMQEGSFPIYNIPYTAGGMWSRGNVLYIRAHLIGECVGSVHFQLFFEPNEVTVFMRKIEETYFQEFEGHLQGHLI